MALIILCALPVFASTPEQDMVLIVDEGDGDFSGLQQVSDEQLAGVEGNVFSSAADGASPLTIKDMKDLGWIKYTCLEGGIDLGNLLSYIGFKYKVEDNCDGTYTVSFSFLGQKYTVTGTEIGIESFLINLGISQSNINKIINAIHNL